MFLGLKTLISLIRKRNGQDPEDKDFLDKTIAAFGYAYDELQDMFYSTLDAWQRTYGYSRIYDESAAVTGMIVDCEPIYFEYNGKMWLIQLWKGQYDLVTGCEVGIYSSDWTTLSIPLIYKSLFYRSAKDDEMLLMYVLLKKKGKILFEREDKHWWLTGFKLGEFSEPSDLTMDVCITLKDEEMRKAFVAGLISAEYKESDLFISENTVGFTFDKPHASQPYTRTAITDWIVQRKNEYLCDRYQDIATPIDNLTDKLITIIVQAPKLYNYFRKKARPTLFKGRAGQPGRAWA
jgi:hypothetical protein